MSEQTQQPPAPASSDEKPHAPEHHYHHEAEKTELEKWLTAAYSKIEPYSNQILMGFIGVAVLLIAVVLWSQSSGSARTAEWEEFVENRVPEDYLELSKKNPDSPVGAWSLLQAGRGFLQEGMRNALSDRKASDERLQQAVDAFEKLLKRSGAPSVAREEALFGLATAKEVLNGDDPSQAIEAYRKLIDDFPESGHVAWATERVAALEKDSTQQFYAWFRKQNPKPGDRPLPTDLAPGGEAPDPSNLDLLDDSMLKLPSTGVGEENTNTVPTDEEMKAKGEEATSEKAAPKSFPAPEKADSEKKPESKEKAGSESEPKESEKKEEVKAEAKPEAEAAPEKAAPAKEEASKPEPEEKEAVKEEAAPKEEKPEE